MRVESIDILIECHEFLARVSRSIQHDELGSPDERLNYPRAKPSEQSSGGFNFEDIIGICPGETDEEFEETLRELRNSGRCTGKPSC